MIISARVIETEPRFGNILGSLTKRQAQQVQNRAINRAGDMTRTAMRKALQKQTGLKAGTVTKALRVRRSSWETLAYTITVRGGDIRLKHFAPRETRQGVSASPFGARRLFSGTFMKGGRFPNRRELNFGGQVLRRIASGRLSATR